MGTSRACLEPVSPGASPEDAESLHKRAHRAHDWSMHMVGALCVKGEKVCEYLLVKWEALIGPRARQGPAQHEHVAHQKWDG